MIGWFERRVRSGRRLVSLEKDDLPWTVKPIPPRIVVVGDIHGDLTGLACILRDRRLIDKKGRWSGGGTHLVLNGDLVGGGNARLLLHYIIRLSSEARTGGAGVHALLGNHDVRVFSKGYQKRLGKTLFRELPLTGARAASPRAAFAGDTAFARFLRERNALLRIGPHLFAHAGLNEWAFRHHPKRINATIRAWIRFWQGAGEQPDPHTEWLALGPGVALESASAGPLWTTSFKTKQPPDEEQISRALDPDDLSRLLRRYGAKRLILGHSPTTTGEIMLSHPYYGETVIMLDTRIRDKKRGRLSCLEIRGDELEAVYPKRVSFGEELQKRELKRLRKDKTRRKKRG
ncbi:MAG: metallophosphoesterase [Spirochaetales bacterium]|nr:metallophosphoesterase [Spirochaetales bacterium]